MNNHHYQDAEFIMAGLALLLLPLMVATSGVDLLLGQRADVMIRFIAAGTTVLLCQELVEWLARR